MSPKPWHTNKRKIALFFIAAAALTTLIFTQEFKYLESLTYDYRMRLASETIASDELVIVAIDDLTIDYLKEPTSLSISDYTKLLVALANYRPRAVGIAKDLESALDQDRVENSGLAFVQAAQELEKLGVPVVIAHESKEIQDLGPKFPLTMLPHAPLNFGYESNPFIEDNVARQALTHLYSRPSFYTELLERSRLLQAYAKYRGEHRETNPQARATYFRYPFKPELTSKKHLVLSFAEVMEETITPSLIRDKVLIIGPTASVLPTDLVRTPFFRDSAQTPKIYVHLAVLNSMISNSTILKGPLFFDMTLTLASVLCVLLSVLNLSPMKGVLAALFVLTSISVFAAILFTFSGVWIGLAHPLVAIFLTYYLSVPYRLIREYQSRWALERKAQIFGQLEEMKTNFLRLVTHDLKTPVARIQGLAETLLMKRRKDPGFDSSERETLQSITKSTDELNRFIGRILDLTRIESDKLSLHLETKDINNLIETSVKRLQTTAEHKRITLHTELEPLFPIPMDTNAISKVLANLIDNAIQYSPPDSKIWIRSNESGEDVCISIEDQGIGLTKEELGQIFSKFYRARQHDIGRVSGSGLGLYLTKYFVDAHHGRVEVESKPGKGSIFRLYLPQSLIPSAGLTMKAQTESKHTGPADPEVGEKL